MAAWLHDVRFALRTLGKRPIFSAVVILVLGLGMGAATSVIDITNVLAWRPLPVEEPESVVKVFSTSHAGFVGPYGSTSYPDYRDYRDQAEAFEGLAAEYDLELRFDSGTSTEQVFAAGVSGNYFDLLRLRPALGRGLGADDDVAGAEQVAVLGHGLWRRLGSDRDVIGRVVRIEGSAFTVVGVAPRGFASTTAGSIYDVFVPIASMTHLEEGVAELLENRAGARFGILGRLADGASLDDAKAEIEVLADRLDEAWPLTNDATRSPSVVPGTIAHPIDRSRMVPTLRLFAAAVALLLLITCANVAHMLLARSAGRRREMAVRQSIGASRFALMRQLLVEGLLLAVAGAAVGLFVARGARVYFEHFAGPEFTAEMRFDVRVLGLTFAVCLATTLLFALAPALAAARVDLVRGLKEGTGAAPGRRSFTAGRLLSTAQIGLCVVLLIAGALLVQSLQHRIDRDHGFDDDHLLIASLNLPSQDYDREQGTAFNRTLLERAAQIPGVERAASSLLVPPLFYDLAIPYRVPGEENPRSARLNFVSDEYFDTLGIELEQGRAFTATDRPETAAVVVINRALAEELWPGEDPLGRTLEVDVTRPGDLGPEYTVVGVVSSIVQNSGSPGVEPVVYFSQSQRYRGRRHIVLDSRGDAEATYEALRGVLRSMDPGLALTNLRTGPENRRQGLTFESMQTQAVGVFAVFGFVLAVLGVFSVMSYAASRRVREIGIRMALGARRSDVLRQMIGQGFVTTAFGVALGLAAALFAARLLDGLLFGLTTTHWPTLLTVVLFVVASALAAAYLPSRRASKLDPLVALRYE